MKIFKPLIALLLSLIVLSGCDTEKAINEVDDLISTISDFIKSDTPEIKNSKEDI
ncbi:endonuclease, partial [Streptococcus equi]|nr:endonuclease [Streptococcus equi]